MNNAPFLLHPAHAAFLDNSNRKLYGVTGRLLIAIIVLGLVCGGMGAGATVYALNETSVQDELAKNGITKLAVVTDEHYTSGRSTTYYLTYTYDAEVNGDFKTFTNEETVSSTLYNKSEIGDRISIRYLPDDPSTVRAVDKDSNVLILVVFGIAFIAGAAFLILTHFRQYRRDRILERDGQIISGNIIKSWTSGVGNKRQLHIRYEFLSPVGMTLNGKQSERRRDIEAANVPPGTKIAVVYQDDNTFRVL